MRKVAGFVVLCIACCCTGAAAQEPACVEPRAACDFFNRYLAAFNARDWEAFRATFDDGITVMFDRPAPPQRVDGRQAVEAMFRRVFPPSGAAPSQLPPPIVPAHLRAQDYGDVVVVSFEIAGGNDLSRRTVILHRGSNGWKVVHIHGSSGPT